MSNKIKFSKKDLDESYEPSDSEEEYTEKEKTLLKKVRNSRNRNQESEKEILRFDAEDSENDENDIEKFEGNSDIEDGDYNDDLPDLQAWGKKKTDFYHTGFIDQDYSTYNEKEEEIAAQEENEAKVIQMQLAKQLDEADFSLDVFSTGVQVEEETETQTILKSDLSTLSQRQKIQLFQKDSPEFDGLVHDFVQRLEESESFLEPILDYFKEKKLTNLPILEFISTKNSLILTYCTNVAFYLVLKAKRIPIKHHPIIKRLLQLRQLLIQLEERYTKIVKPQLEQFLEDIKTGKEIIFDTSPIEKKKKEKKTKKLSILKNLEVQEGEEDDDEMDSDEEDLIPQAKKIKLTHDSDDEDDKIDEDENDDEEADNNAEGGDEKRAITYQIAKNKGLTPRRKKEQRNPRVKHRNKYKKAIIRRKGQVRTVRTETSRYAGEMSGIKSTVRKSIKIK